MAGRMHSCAVWALMVVLTCRQGLAQVPKTVVINEVLASNASTLADPQGEYDDWIELYNPSDEQVDVGTPASHSTPTATRSACSTRTAVPWSTA